MGLRSILVIKVGLDKFADIRLRPTFAKASASKTGKAKVAELVDAHDSKSCPFGGGGSIPPFGTKKAVRDSLFVWIIY